MKAIRTVRMGLRRFPVSCSRIASVRRLARWIAVVATAAAVAALPGAWPPVARADDKPLLSVPRTTTAPAIDGKLDEAAWKTAASTKDFALFPASAASPSRETEVLVLHDGDNLYVAFRCEEPATARLVKRAAGHDADRIWEDDEVEFFVDPHPAGNPAYFQLIVNAAGILFDREHAGKEVAWNAEGAKGAAAIGSGEWVAEMSLPLKGLDVPAPTTGTRWGVNFTRHVKTVEPDEWLTWAPIASGGFLQPNLFGEIRFE